MVHERKTRRQKEVLTKADLLAGIGGHVETEQGDNAGQHARQDEMEDEKDRAPLNGDLDVDKRIGLRAAAVDNGVLLRPERKIVSVF